MKKISNKEFNKSKSLSSKKRPLPDFVDIPNSNNKLNNIKKFDIHKLSSLLDDLVKKDLEYDLIIKGYKEKINTKKRENNFLMQEIQTINKQNKEMNNNNKKLNVIHDIKTKENKIEVNYKNNIANLNMMNIKEKYNQEIIKNKEIKENIIKIQRDINIYKNRLNELEMILNKGNFIIEKEEENMKKFLSEL